MGLKSLGPPAPAAGGGLAGVENPLSNMLVGYMKLETSEPVGGLGRKQ